MLVGFAPLPRGKWAGAVTAPVRKLRNKLKKSQPGEGVYSKVQRSRDAHQSSTFEKWYLGSFQLPLCVCPHLSLSLFPNWEKRNEGGLALTLLEGRNSDFPAKVEVKLPGKR